MDEERTIKLQNDDTILPVNLMSDTVTKPTPKMLEVMMLADVGDDVFGLDPSVNKLEQTAADLFGKEAAIFCPSGTMTNQIAIQLHTGRTDTVLCEKGSHIYQYETGGYAYNAGVGIDLIEGSYGKITAAQVEAHIRPAFDWYPRTSLVILENTCNKGGGSIYRLEEVLPISGLCRSKGIGIHLDGARIFNALIETQEDPEEWGRAFDTISICLSKGLGAPVGSLLLGHANRISEARRLRKVMGGGMRQAGYLAAAGLYALEHHRTRLKEDHHHASLLAETLGSCSFVNHIRPVQSNIVIFSVEDGTAASLVEKWKEQGILAVALGPDLIRFVTHLDVTNEMVERARKILKDNG